MYALASETKGCVSVRLNYHGSGWIQYFIAIADFPCMMICSFLGLSVEGSYSLQELCMGDSLWSFRTHRALALVTILLLHYGLLCVSTDYGSLLSFLTHVR